MQLTKKKIVKLLNEKKVGELVNVASGDKKIVSILISLSYDKKSIISWRAIEAIGLITKEVSGSDSELVLPSQFRPNTARLCSMGAW